MRFFRLNGHYVAPFPKVLIFFVLAHDCDHAEPIASLWHQICDDALVCPSKIDLAELLLLVDFLANAILEFVSQGFLVSPMQLLWMAPYNLDSRCGASLVKELTLGQRVCIQSVKHLSMQPVILFRISLDLGGKSSRDTLWATTTLRSR